MFSHIKIEKFEYKYSSNLLIFMIYVEILLFSVFIPLFFNNKNLCLYLLYLYNGII